MGHLYLPSTQDQINLPSTHDQTLPSTQDQTLPSTQDQITLPSDTDSPIVDIELVPSTSTDNDAALLNERMTNITRSRKHAYDGQLAQAEKMVKWSKIDFKPGEVGENVSIQIPLVDRGRADARNILGITVDRDLKTDIYTIAVKAGILTEGYTRNQFNLCPQKTSEQGRYEFGQKGISWNSCDRAINIRWAGTSKM